ncbi:hypothetical protein PRK78_002159 [Emydomyces testavorans]|uniref:CREG-like beta-barrel domain-containing protein n=1 Tax=Emydomyces testavorans TaxID=2070801 RepID=A0AAF0IHJ4_9EURO|nr:hypothetical protein PRK78_002159 [Emydomyces testavorans]
MKLLTFPTFFSLLLPLRLGSASPVSSRGIHNDITRQEPLLPNSPPSSAPEPDSGLKTILDIEPESNVSIPDWPTSHLLARRLLALSSTGVLSTIYQKDNRNPALVGVPVGLPDYFADCENEGDPKLLNLLGPGNPLVLALNIGTTFRNTKAGSNISLSIDWWHNAPSSVDGNLDDSPAAFPRLSLLGWLDPLPSTFPDASRETMEKCFLAAHPDAKSWLPGDPNAAHRGYWARLVVEEAFWVGGFGDRARIGWLNPQTWKAIKKSGKEGEKGWADVRLPGEKAN